MSEDCLETGDKLPLNRYSGFLIQALSRTVTAVRGGWLCGTALPRRLWAASLSLWEGLG